MVELIGGLTKLSNKIKFVKLCHAKSMSAPLKSHQDKQLRGILFLKYLPTWSVYA